MTNPVFLRCTLTILMIGFTLHLTGLLFIVDGSVYTTISNLGLFLPALILCICDPSLRKGITEKKYHPTLLLLAFSVLVTLLNPEATRSFFVQFKTALYVVLYLGAIHILNREKLLEKTLTFTLLLAGICAIASLAINSVVQEQNIFFSELRLSRLGYGAYADFKNPIIAALYFGFFGVYGFHLLLTKPHGPGFRALLMICVLGLSLYLFCTFSRAVWLAYAVAVCTTIFFHHNTHSRKWLYLAAVMLLVFAAWLWPILLNQQSRGFSLRDFIWADWLDRLGDFWLVGAGAGRNFETCVLESQCFNQAHSLFLQFFYEYGIIGFGLLLLTIALVFKHAKDRKTWTSPIGSVGLPLLIFGILSAIFDYHTVLSRPGVYWIVFWLPIGIILSQTSSPCAQRMEANNAH